MDEITPCLRVGLELAAALETTAERGWEHLPAALDRDFLPRLQEEIESGPFAAAPGDVGQVHQELDRYVIAPADAASRPFATQLRETLTQRVRQEGAHIEGLASYAANEVDVQRYAPHSAGISCHRDPSRFRPLLAVVTTSGRARFSVHPERHADPVATWQVAAGDLVLLRGPGLGGMPDGRPFHAVSGPLGEEARYSLGIRRDAERQDLD